MNWNQWQNLSDELVKELPYPVADWLLEFGSLTEKLNRNSQSPIKLDLLKQATAAITVAEKEAIKCDKLEAPLREVVLHANDQPWVFARTVVNGQTQALIDQLGAKPLGSILFNDQHLRRQFLQIKKLFAGDPLYAKVTDYLKGAQPEFLWARRSLWVSSQQQQDYALLVNEVFLPDSPLY